MLATQEFTFRDLAALFDACGLNYATRPGDQVILASFESQAGSQPMVARLDGDRQTAGLYFRLPLTASEHRRPQVVRLAVRMAAAR